MANSVTYFNRHESMDSTTRRLIMDTISDLEIIENCPSANIINCLYGAFDGYDYSQVIQKDPVFSSLNAGGNSHLAQEIQNIFTTISQYPRTVAPNNNNF